jgi:hypothetical protein
LCAAGRCSWWRMPSLRLPIRMWRWRLVCALLSFAKRHSSMCVCLCARWLVAVIVPSTCTIVQFMCAVTIDDTPATAGAGALLLVTARDRLATGRQDIATQRCTLPLPHALRWSWKLMQDLYEASFAVCVLTCSLPHDEPMLDGRGLGVLPPLHSCCCLSAQPPHSLQSAVPPQRTACRTRSDWREENP